MTTEMLASVPLMKRKDGEVLAYTVHNRNTLDPTAMYKIDMEPKMTPFDSFYIVVRFCPFCWIIMGWDLRRAMGFLCGLFVFSFQSTNSIGSISARDKMTIPS